MKWDLTTVGTLFLATLGSLVVSNFLIDMFLADLIGTTEYAIMGITLSLGFAFILTIILMVMLKYVFNKDVK